MLLLKLIIIHVRPKHTWNGRFCCSPAIQSSSETQGQLVGAGKSLNGREKNFGRRKVKKESFFLARLDFSPPPLTAPGSPRMQFSRKVWTKRKQGWYSGVKWRARLITRLTRIIRRRGIIHLRWIKTNDASSIKSFLLAQWPNLY